MRKRKGKGTAHKADQPHASDESVWPDYHQILINNLRAKAPELKALFIEASSHWNYEDPVYRFYHQSFKVYGVQAATLKIVEALRALLPDRPLDKDFVKIVEEGTGKVWERAHNRRWLAETRPMLEAFFHARYFLEMAVRYSKKFKRRPQMMPSGWASLMYLYDLRGM